MHYKNNWISFLPEPKINFSKIPTDNFYNELLNNGSLLYDTFGGPLDLFFSGGVNSQLVLRTYIDLKIPIKVLIIKFENNYNVEDVTAAISICKQLDVNYQIIDFQLEKFFANDAEDILKKSGTIDLKKLPLLKAIESSDGIPIIGNRDPYIYRSSYFYDQPADWLLKMTNEDFIFQKYKIGKPIIGDWFFYSPEVLVSFLDTELIQKLTSDRLNQRLSSVTSRGNLYKSIWKDFNIREKNTGYENARAAFIYPDFMLDFFEKFMKNFQMQMVSTIHISSVTNV